MYDQSFMREHLINYFSHHKILPVETKPTLLSTTEVKVYGISRLPVDNRQKMARCVGCLVSPEMPIFQQVYSEEKNKKQFHMSKMYQLIFCELIREYSSTLYVGLARDVSPTNTNFRLTFLLTRLQEALYEDLAEYIKFEVYHHFSGL